MGVNRYFVLAGLVVSGSAAHATPAHRKSAVDAKPTATAPATAADDGAEADVEEPAPKDIADSRQRTSPRGWTLAIGPYVWASSVQIDASFGPVSAGVDIGFVSLVRHSRYGAEAAFEARRGHFSISGDIMYGVAEFSGATEVASVMASAAGKAGTLLLDSAVGYELVGDDAAGFSLEARSGVRYQRTTVQADLGVAGVMLQTPELVDDAADLVLGGRAILRPTRWLQLAGGFDVGVAGASDSTWSATLDASLRVSSWAQVTAGWRTLTTQRAIVKIEMSGPRVALQFLF